MQLRRFILETYNKYSIKEVHNLFREWKEQYWDNPEYDTRQLKKIVVTFDDVPVKIYSQRYELFLSNITCVHCGLVASYYKLERQPASRRYHFNLYGIKDGQEVLFTKDHIVPKSKGGGNQMHNYQTMCTICNIEKGSNIVKYSNKGINNETK